MTTDATHPGNSNTLQVGEICDGNYFPGLTSDQSGKIIFHRAKDIPRERDAGRKWHPTLMLSLLKPRWAPTCGTTSALCRLALRERERERERAMKPSNEWGSSGGKQTRACSSRCAQNSCARYLADLRIVENTLGSSGGKTKRGHVRAAAHNVVPLVTWLI